MLQDAKWVWVNMFRRWLSAVSLFCVVISLSVDHNWLFKNQRAVTLLVQSSIQWKLDALLPTLRLIVFVYFVDMVVGRMGICCICLWLALHVQIYPQYAIVKHLRGRVPPPRCDWDLDWWVFWRHQAFCITDPFWWNPPVIGGFHHKRLAMRGFGALFIGSQNKLLNNYLNCRWFEWYWRPR